MKTRFLPALAIAAVGTATAADIPPSVPMSGFARYEFNKWLFRPCVGSGKKAGLAPQGQPIIDATEGGLLFKAIQQRWQQSADPQRGIYFEFAGYIRKRTRDRHPPATIAGLGRNLRGAADQHPG